MKQSADNSFKFDENSRKFSQQVENIVGKGEIAYYEQFLLFPQCFQKACFTGASGVIVWEWVNVYQISSRSLCILFFTAFTIILIFNQMNTFNPLPSNHTFEFFTKQQISRLFNIESICRQKNNESEKMKFDLQWVENIVGKGENAFFSFPTMF